MVLSERGLVWKAEVAEVAEVGLERLEGDGQVVNPEDGAVCGDLDDSLQ